MTTMKLYKTCRGNRLSTMTDEEFIRISGEMTEAYEAGEEERGDELSSLLPISLEMALCMVEMFGREALVDFNTNDIEAFYGPDWIEKYGRKSYQAHRPAGKSGKRLSRTAE